MNYWYSSYKYTCKTCNTYEYNTNRHRYVWFYCNLCGETDSTKLVKQFVLLKKEWAGCWYNPWTWFKYKYTQKSFPQVPPVVKFQEGKVRKGGINQPPTTPRPTISPPPQRKQS